MFFFFFKQKTAYEMRISDWSSDVCSSDLEVAHECLTAFGAFKFGYAPGPGLGAEHAAHDVRASKFDHGLRQVGNRNLHLLVQVEFVEIGRASCRERVCQYV